jgi:hypothetical protein
MGPKWVQKCTNAKSSHLLDICKRKGEVSGFQWIIQRNGVEREASLRTTPLFVARPDPSTRLTVTFWSTRMIHYLRGRDGTIEKARFNWWRRIKAYRRKSVPLPPCTQQGKEENWSYTSWPRNETGQRSESRSSRVLTRGRILRHPLHRRLGGPQTWPGHRG